MKNKKKVIIGIGALLIIFSVLYISGYLKIPSNSPTLSVVPDNDFICCITSTSASLLAKGNACPSWTTETIPSRFEDSICISSSESYQACQGGGLACQYGFDISTGRDKYIFWCDLDMADSLVTCEQGCNITSGTCNEGVRTCTEGNEAREKHNQF